MVIFERSFTIGWPNPSSKRRGVSVSDDCSDMAVWGFCASPDILQSSEEEMSQWLPTRKLACQVQQKLSLQTIAVKKKEAFLWKFKATNNSTGVCHNFKLRTHVKKYSISSVFEACRWT